MELNVSLIRQPKGSPYCGHACVATVLNYWGINKSLKEVITEIKTYKFGTFSPQLGIYFLEQGFSVEIVTQHPALFTIFDRKMNSKKIIERLRKISRGRKLKKHKNAFRYYIQFLEKGGKIKVGIPSRDEIESEIKNKRPLIALLTSVFLNQEMPEFNFHFNVITGIDDKYIYANDPAGDKTGGKRKHAIADYLFGIYASTYGDLDNGCLIKIKK